VTDATPGRRLVRAAGPGGRPTAARSPFVLLIVVLLAGGLISLLLLNAAVNQDSFTLSKLQKETDQLTDEQQALQQEVDGYSAPGDLDNRARQLGMVPGGNPAFLSPSGAVRGDPSAAKGSPAADLSAPGAPSDAALPTPAATAGPGGGTPSPSAAPSAPGTGAPAQASPERQ
jgi:cell division protein FtsB